MARFRKGDIIAYIPEWPILSKAYSIRIIGRKKSGTYRVNFLTGALDWIYSTDYIDSKSNYLGRNIETVKVLYL